MQVSHQNDHITHAVIGGKQGIEFGISNSAEFFNILSSTLYKDQILAVVREVLCNAWDAHIEAGCTDRPVLITLTDDLFTIKDFGKGIHHDDMGLIYGTYGNSTKKNDGKQTGGFGLGCKAPFAYTDHFDVVSAHAGIRTVYNLSKSSAQAVGKPGITPITSFPSEESGLSVTIRIKPGDRLRFEELILRIAHNGDMNMKLNGVQLKTLEFDVSKQNFLLTRARLLGARHRIMVRYGNVIYPAETSGNEQEFSAICNHLNALRGNHQDHFCIVFQAPPHSIAVTPSRETLSMQEHTVNTLGKLFKDFLASLETDFKQACLQYTDGVIQKAVAAKRVDELLKREEALPELVKHDLVLRIDDFDEMAKTFLQFNYPKGLDYRKQDITLRLEAMAQNNLLDRGKVQSFLRELKGVQKECSSNRSWHVIAEPTNWLQRRVIRPLLCGLAEAGLPADRLFSCSPEDHNWKPSNRDGVAPLVQATRTSPHHLLTTIPFLRNIVVLATRRADLTARAFNHPVFRGAGRYYGYLVYIVGRKKGEIDAAREFFAQTGMVVADLIQSEEAEKPENTITVPRKPAKKGVTKLSSIKGTYSIDIAHALREDAERIEAPEFILQVSYRSSHSSHSIDRWSKVHTALLVKLFGDKGAITNSTATFDKWCGKGAVPFMDYVRTKICQYMLTNPRIKAYWAYSRDHLEESNHIQLINLIYGDDRLSAEFGLVNPLTDEDKEYLALWHALKQQDYYAHTEVAQVNKFLKAIPASSEVLALKKQLTAPMLPFLDTGEFSHAVRNASPAHLTKLVNLLKTILNA